MQDYRKYITLARGHSNFFPMDLLGNEKDIIAYIPKPNLENYFPTLETGEWEYEFCDTFLKEVLVA